MKAWYAADMDDRLQTAADRHPSRLLTMSLITAVWCLWYAIYRAYYGLGGTVGMFAMPKSKSQWRAINLAGAAILLVIAVLPVAVLPLWKKPRMTCIGLLAGFGVIGKIIIG
jgi:hypothetical protein